MPEDTEDPSAGYAPDGFRYVDIRVDPVTREGVPERKTRVFQNDAVTVTVIGVRGCDPAAVVGGLYSDAGDALTAPAVWRAVPGSDGDAIYANLSLATAAAAGLAAGLTPDADATIHLSLWQTGGPAVARAQIPFARCLAATGGGSAGEVSAFVTAASVAAIAAEVAAMPSNDAYSRHQQLLTLLARLAALHVP